MRYQIQLLTTGPQARRAAETAIADGLVAEPDACPAFVQGVVDEAQFAALTERGLLMSILSELPDAPPSGPIARSSGLGRKTIFEMTPAAPAIAVRRAPDGYYRVLLKGLLSPRVRERLEAMGVRFLERLGERLWSIRLDGDPRPAARDAAVAELAAADSDLGARARSAGFGVAGAAPDTVEDIAGDPIAFEALLEPDADPDAVMAALRDRGIEPLGTRTRLVRFLAPATRVAAVATISGVAAVTPAGLPRLLHDVVRPLVGVTGSVGDRPAGLDGEGELVGVADTGIDQSHPDFAGRIFARVDLGRSNDTSDPHGHGTHVAGTIVGDGAASGGDLAGIAPAARLYFQSLLDARGGLGGIPDDVGDLFAPAYAAGVRIHNNSWGIFLNARYSGPSFDVDRFVCEHPDFLPVIAAGNDGSCLPGRNSGGAGLVDLPSVGVPATAKNALIVGASRSSRTSLGFAELAYGELWPDEFADPPIGTEKVSGNPDCLAAFSARGPTDDWRVKPDVVAPGTDIASTRSADAPYRNFWGAYPGNDHYALMGGTSMACPVVAGIAVLVRQYYRRDCDHLPSAALLRATIVNGTEPLGGADAVAAPVGSPNFHQGFGRVDFARTLPMCGKVPALAFVDTWDDPGLRLMASGDGQEFEIETDRSGELRFCLAWTDPAGRALQNALMIAVETPAGEILTSNRDVARQFGFTTPHPAGAPGQFFDRDPNNNLHILRLPDAAPGLYRATVASFDLASPQDFALVATGPVGAFSKGTA